MVEPIEDWLRREAVRFRTPITWTGSVQPLAMPIMLTPERAERLADLVAAVREERRLARRMDAYSSRDLRGNPPTITTVAMEHTAAEEAIEAALAALDEASR